MMEACFQSQPESRCVAHDPYALHARSHVEVSQVISVRDFSMLAYRADRSKPKDLVHRSGTSDYSRETERKVERLLAELYETLQIQKPDDLFGSVVIETRYQSGRPVGQVDVQIRYVMKRVNDPRS
jgi:hypothetical protein